MKSCKLFMNRNITRRFLREFHTFKNLRVIVNRQDFSHKNVFISKNYNVILSNTKRHFHVSRMTRAKIIPFNLADIGEGIKEVEIINWFVKEGDEIHQFDKICEVQSDKANVEITSRYDGKITKLYYKKGDIAQVGEPLIDIQVSDAEVEETPSSQIKEEGEQKVSSPSEKPSSSSGKTKILTTPAVRRIAREYNINLAEVEATGKDGRVMKEDVLRYLELMKKPKPVGLPKEEPIKTATIIEPPTTPTTSIPTITLEDRVEPVRGLTRTMIKTMTAAAQVPTFAFFDDWKVDNLIKLRQELKPYAEKENVKLTYMPFFIKIASLALTKYPILNASLSQDHSQIIYKASHNIGIAMDSPNGLIVPNIKNVQNKSIFEIAKELQRLQNLAMDGKLGMEDLQGGTFTLSNIGTIGGTYALPVLVVPEVCIGAIGKIKKVPVFNEKNEVVPVNILNVSWTADHRIVDGATMARFNNEMKSIIENPQSLFLLLK